MAMEFMIVITLTLATSYLATAAPFNVTNSSLCFCRADKDASDGDTYQSLIASLNSLYSYCTFPNMECTSSSEALCEGCLPLTNITNQLEVLLGILEPLAEVCEDEERKFFRGEQSLYELCVAVDCSVKPSAQSVAEYLLNRTERCNCVEEDYLYVPGQCVEFEGNKSITELFSALYESVNSLRIFFCHLQVFPPFTNVERVCAAFPPNGNGDEDDQVPPAPGGRQ